MSSRSDCVEAITKRELVRAIKKKTGFTIPNCTKAFDAVVEVFAETLLDGRAIPLVHLGRIEPYTKPERTMYYLDKNTGVRLNEDGSRITYTVPPTRWIKFHTAKYFKYKLNPGIYFNEPVDTEDSD